MAKLITTDEECAAAISRIDEIWDTAVGSPEELEFLDLAAAIEAYENLRWPIGEPTPTEAAEFRAEQEAPAVAEAETGAVDG